MSEGQQTDQPGRPPDLESVVETFRKLLNAPAGRRAGDVSDLAVGHTIDELREGKETAEWMAIAFAGELQARRRAAEPPGSPS